MPAITSDHDQGVFRRTAPQTPNPGKSRYSYLFPDLARATGVGVFSDSSGNHAETLRRMLDVAIWIEQQNSAVDTDAANLRIPIPAAYTYFGQFVNHDLSAPVGGLSSDVAAIPDAATITDTPLSAADRRRGKVDDILLHFQNEHAAPLSLGSLYGEGPFPADGQPPAPEIRALFDAAGLRFRLGTACDASAGFAALTATPAQVVRLPGAPDIPRQTSPGQPPLALIADLRNDENLLISQVHLALMLLHNKAAGALAAAFPDPKQCFAKARQLVTRHYHWIILHDFLPRLLSQSALPRLDLNAPPRLTRAEVPMEFTTAAFRFGHSMVADSYDYNANFGTDAHVSNRAALIELFSFTTKGGMGTLGPHSQLPDHWVVDWDRLTDPNRGGKAQSDKLDMTFAQMMMKAVQGHNDGIGSIIGRNLVRSFQRRIPFGQALARASNVPVMTEDEIRSAMPRGLETDPQHAETPTTAAKRKTLLRETPAWLYFLCEAKVREGGNRLGATASQIIADTFVGLIRLDTSSIRGGPGGDWTPELSPFRTADGRALRTLRDLLMFAVAP